MVCRGAASRANSSHNVILWLNFNGGALNQFRSQRNHDGIIQFQMYKCNILQ
jgi:hypothetical protein